MTPEVEELRVLIVDDEPPVRLLVDECLSGEGFACRQAESVEQAMARLAAEEFHLIVSDLRMPGMDGFDLLRHVEGLAEEIGVVVVTAVGDVETAVRALREGACDYLVKPFRPDELVERVRGAVERVGLRRENRRYAMHLRHEVERRTEHLRAIQDDLRRSEERRRLLLQQAGEPFLTLDGHSGEILEANRRAEALLGYRTCEMDGLPLRSLDAEGDLARIMDQLAGERAAGGRSSLPLLRKDRSKVEVAVSAARVNGPDGPLVSLILRDINEERPAWPRFLATLSHELRTPLTSILGHADIVRMLGGRLDEQQLQSLRNIRVNARQCIRLVEDLLDLARGEEGEGPAREEDVSVAEVVEAVVKTLEPLAADKGITLETVVPGEIPSLRGDGQALRRALLNLASNAIQYTRRGGVRIRVRRVGDALVARVVDTGVGIAREDRARIFEEGERVGNGPSGVGLGLAIARRLAARLNGEIRVWSRFGIGSVFTLSVHLPRAEMEPGSAPPTRAPWIESA